MANNDGRRAVIQDPLAPNPREQRPDRSLQLSGVHAPQTPSAASLTNSDGITQALTGVEGLLAQEFEKKKDGWITEGKVAYQSGVTEQAMLESGNAFTAQGYRTLQARDQVNNWFTDQTIAMEDTGKQIDPQQYAAQLKQQRADILSGISDPQARKVASAAFEDMSPRLASTQAIKNNEYNRQQRINSFSTTLSSTGSTSATASKQEPGSPIAVSPVPVGPVMQPSARDRDVGIRTMLGEAANEGADGLAAVAHVLRNRATDPRWPNTIAGVALQPKQFSAWNDGPGGNNIPYNNGPGSPMYERAGKIFDTVMAGNNVDQTGGATHYYSPVGMAKLVADGDQPNAVPKWLDEETARGGGRIKIGGHIFVGKSADAAVRPSVDVPAPTGQDGKAAPQVTATTIAAGTQGDLNAVPSQEHVGVTGVAQASGVNEIQQLIHGYKGLNDADKATAVSDAMRRSLDAGNDTMVRDAGGISALHKLGAKPGEIDEVIKAQKRYDDKQQTEFNVGREKYRTDILGRAENGEDINTILADIDAKHTSGFMNDANARSLAASAADKVRTANGEKSKLSNPDMLNELGGLYQNIATGGDFKSMAEQGKKIADKYGATEKDVQHIVGKMFSDSQTYQNKMREEAKVAAKTKLEQDGVKSGVDRAISQGYGLKNTTGSVKVTNDAGLPETVTAEEYGVRQIKDKWGKQYSDAVQNGQMTIGQAKPELERKVALELQTHDVVDKQMSGQLQGALSKNIISKSGSVTPEAIQAYDSWLTLKTTPNITPGYLAKVVPDNGTRTLLETAYMLDSGTLSKEQSLLKAHEILNDPNRDPKDAINKDVVWKQKMDVDMPKTLLARTDPGFFNRLFGTYDKAERERILTSNKTAENYVNMRADAYHFENPNEPGEVSLTKGLQDLQAHSTPVMGNLIITKPGKELASTMGVAGFGPNAAEDAMKTYFEKNGAKIWGASWTDRVGTQVGGRTVSDNLSNAVSDSSTLPVGYDRPSKFSNAMHSIANFDREFSPQGIARAIAPGKFDSADHYKGEEAHPSSPPLSMTYNAELGVMTVDMYADKEMTRTLGAPKHFNVRSIGNEYAKEQTTPTTWAKAWNGLFKGTAKAIKDAAAESANYPD
jgi:spore germination cell wall hydrolase CwlJ-like protein